METEDAAAAKVCEPEPDTTEQAQSGTLQFTKTCTLFTVHFLLLHTINSVTIGTSKRLSLNLVTQRRVYPRPLSVYMLLLNTVQLDRFTICPTVSLLPSIMRCGSSSTLPAAALCLKRLTNIFTVLL